MMFEDAQFFGGLTAWFSTSVPAKVKSIWIKRGGVQSSDFTEADYIFSSDAAADDTATIFASSKYKNEQLTIFNSSFIEDFVTSNGGCLGGKCLSGFILIPPQYQKEMDQFLRGKCSRVYKRSSRVLDNTLIDRGMINSHKTGKSTRKVQTGDDENIDEWEFVDESDIRVKSLSDVRRLSAKLRKPDADKHHANADGNEQQKGLSSPTSQSAVKYASHSPKKVAILDSRKQNNGDSHNTLRNLSSNSAKQNNTSTRTDQRNCHGSVTHNLPCAVSNKTNSNRTSKRFAKGYREEDSSVTTLPMVTDSHLLEHKAKDSPVNRDKHPNKDRSASLSASNFRLQFLSSMDNGFVHIDDINLPDIPIDDFVPNFHGCRVEFK